MKRFILLIYTLCFFVGYSLANDIQQAYSAFEMIEEKGVYVDEINLTNLKSFPIGLHKTIGNTPVTLAISNVVFHNGYAEIDIYAKVVMPQNVVLCFGAQKIKFSYNGSFIGNVKLALLEDLELPAFSDNSLKLIFRGGSNRYLDAEDLSFATISCKGIEEFGLAIDAEFSDKFIVPVDKNGEIIVGEKLRTSFSTTASDLDDIFVKVNLPAFAVNGLDGYSFACENVVFDYSLIKHEQEVKFPNNYQQNFFPECDIKMWRGFYAKNISVTLPSCFKEKDSNKKLSFATNHLIIDEYGLSGLFKADIPILSIEKGDASGWNISVNRFALALEANQLTEASFGGEIGIPVSDSLNSTLEYTGLFDVYNNYYLSVEVKDSLSFDIFSARASIRDESYLKLQVKDKKFRPEALLHGNLNIKVKDKKSSEDSKVKMSGIEFQSLKIQTEIPYFSADYLGYKGSGSITGIPIYLDNLYLSSDVNYVNLGCGIGIELGGIVSGKTDFTIRSKTSYENNKLHWKYDKFILNSIHVGANIAEVLTLNGSVTMYENDPLYGNGFSGSLNLEMKKVLEDLKLSARAYFGNNGYDYWMADASIHIPGGIPCGPVTLNGFTGGISSRMKRIASKKSEELDRYIPDENYGLGLKAGIMASFCSDNLVSAEATFEIIFNKHGGLNFIGIYGNASFLEKMGAGALGTLSEKTSQILNKVTEAEEKITGGNAKLIEKLCLNKSQNPQKTCKSVIADEEVKGMKAKIVLQYDFINNAFDAQLEMAVNVQEIIYGSGVNYSAGKAVIHIDANKWYLHVGRPDNPIALSIGIAKMISINASAYLMAGHDLPSAPAPPAQIANILGAELESLNYMRDLNSLNQGKGVAFGSQLSIDTGDLYFLILYARFQAGVGFDIMLKDYENAQCYGYSDNIGINGWYANGQSYAYLSGELGVGVNLFIIQTKIPIISGGMATLLQSMLPNPTWFYGQIGVNIDLLGGLAKGNLDFKFEIGEKCQLMQPGQSPLGTEIIGGIEPTETNEVDVFAVPQVAFNMPINTEFIHTNKSGKTKMRIILKNFELKDNNNNIVAGETKWNSNKDKVSLYTVDILYPHTTYTLTVSLGFEEYTNGKWTTINTAGKESVEQRTITFITGDAPKNIPFTNIAYMYPVKDQGCFYPKEHTEGFVQLIKGQDYLFSSEYNYVADFISVDDNKITSTPVKYNSSNNSLSFNIPNLNKKTEYNIQFKGILEKSEDVISQATYRAVENAGDIKVKENKTDQLSNQADALILSYNFTTSKYSKFSDKIKAMKKEKPWYDKVNSTVYSVGYTIKNSELFDKVEVLGDLFTNNTALIKLKATGKDEYYTNKISPLYKQSLVSLKGNRTDSYGNPPFEAITINHYYEKGLNNETLDSDWFVFPWLYEPHIYYLKDWNYVRSKMIDKQCSGYMLNTQEKIFRGHFPLLTKGEYPVIISYVLPNGHTSSETPFEFKNEF